MGSGDAELIFLIYLQIFQILFPFDGETNDFKFSSFA